MDDNLLLPGISYRNAEIIILLCFLVLMAFPWITILILGDVTSLSIYLPDCIQKPTIPSRLGAVIDINSREMGNLLTLMKLWESRSCQKLDHYKIDKDTMTRLRRFLNAMESLDLTNKIYELKGLSSHLNLVTQGLLRSQLLKAIDLIMTWRPFSDYYLHRVLVSEG